MKPGPRDHRHKLRIYGAELRELKRHTGSMAEAFGLDRKIDEYAGVRPITLYRWDLDCLMAVIAFALQDKSEYPDESAQEDQDLAMLDERLRREYEAVYGKDG
jgi:hypothetical protein